MLGLQEKKLRLDRPRIGTASQPKTLYVGREKVDGSVTTKEAFARPKYIVIIAASRDEDRGAWKKTRDLLK
jgi:hypothetical protein